MPAEAEGVLILEADVVTAMGPLVSLLVEQSGMPGKPVGLVEVGRFTVPALVMGFEPDGPFEDRSPVRRRGSQVAQM